MTEQAPTIRIRADNDLPGAAAALVHVHATDGYPVEGVDDPVAWLTGPTLRRAWIVEVGTRIVGHVSVTDPHPVDAAAAMWRGQAGAEAGAIAVLGRLFVVPDARRRAIGEHLVRVATQDARDNGLRLVLDVMAKDVAAIALYERLGWRRVGTTGHDNGHGDTIPAYCYVSPA